MVPGPDLSEQLVVEQNVTNDGPNRPKDPEVPASLREFCIVTSGSDKNGHEEAINSSMANDPRFWLAALMKNRYLNENQLYELCVRAKSILIKLPNVISVRSPCFIVGDIHGQFYDLRKMFEISHLELGTHYVFLGDYVDRGYYSLESFSLLLTLLILYPDRFVLLRGNHETRQTTRYYGFYDECMRKYGSAGCWRLLCEIFDLLPIAAVIDDEIFCIHGGLTPHVNHIDNIHLIQRNCEVPESGAFCHLLWSDPAQDMQEDYRISPRGAGVEFGENANLKFCHRNSISLVARAHQLIQEGIQYMFNNMLVTVWSAPNYCYRSGNIASILEIKDGSRIPMIFDAVPEKERKMERLITPYFL